MSVRLVDSSGRTVAKSRSREAAHRETRRSRHAGSHLQLVRGDGNRAGRPGFVQMGGRDVLPRDFHLPKEARGKTPVTIEDLEVYLYETVSARDMKPRYGAVVFAGKAQKPLWHYVYGTEKARDEKIAETIKARRGIRKRKETEAAAKKAYRHDHKVGDVFSTSWGYEQSNSEFFQVVEVKGSDLIVREIAQASAARPAGPMDTGGSMSMTDRVVGIPGKFVGKPIRVRPQHGGSVKIEGHYASKWNGSPQYTSSYA